MISNRKLKDAAYFAKVFLTEIEKYSGEYNGEKNLQDAIRTRKLHEASRTLQRSLKTLSGERAPR